MSVSYNLKDCGGAPTVYTGIGSTELLAGYNKWNMGLSYRPRQSSHPKAIPSPSSAMTDESCKCRRWAVSLKSTLESDQFDALYRKAVQCITPQEYERLPQFMHREDTLAGLIGRLLYRHAASKFTGVPWAEIKFERTSQGKPFLVNPSDTKFGLNVSHQGDYVGFSSSCTDKVGVDLMRLDKERNNKTADEYINSMAKSASPEELRMMRSQPTEAMKMTIFYRYWCLKEAILKATGEGILPDLSIIDFRVSKDDKYKPGCFLTSTTVNREGQPQDQWIFEESFIDINHSVAVCKEKRQPRECKFRQDREAKMFFQKVPFATLLEDATMLNHLPDNGTQAVADFLAKPRKTF